MWAQGRARAPSGAPLWPRAAKAPSLPSAWLLWLLLVPAQVIHGFSIAVQEPATLLRASKGPGRGSALGWDLPRLLCLPGTDRMASARPLQLLCHRAGLQPLPCRTRTLLPARAHPPWPHTLLQQSLPPARGSSVLLEIIFLLLLLLLQSPPLPCVGGRRDASPPLSPALRAQSPRQSPAVYSWLPSGFAAKPPSTGPGPSCLSCCYSSFPLNLGWLRGGRGEVRRGLQAWRVSSCPRLA